MAFLFVPFPFPGDIRKPSSSGYDRKVPEYMEFQQDSSIKYNLVLRDLGVILWRNLVVIPYIPVLSCRTQRNYVS